MILFTRLPPSKALRPLRLAAATTAFSTAKPTICNQKNHNPPVLVRGTPKAMSMRAWTMPEAVNATTTRRECARRLVGGMPRRRARWVALLVRGLRRVWCQQFLR
ncbi:hypothetical protein BJX61DRAFT_134650 [Aspergillus egyptiacus]|nr:hypothetical protein BJX61DRAFT_134650 [Aspergillus egyptiacus]